MNEVTNSNLQLRTSAVSSKPDAGKVEQGGKSLPSVAVSEQLSEKGKIVSTEKPGHNTESVSQKQEKIESAVAEMNEYIQSTQRDIEFNVDDSLGRTIVSVVDRESQEVIRQIPDEKFLKMARQLKEDMAAGTDEPLHLISARA
ncbi:MAG: flagellar protein FlaG [Cellvibrionaceae bacterium]